MGPALLNKTIRDLRKRKVRTFFTVLTISLGVMGVALFAVNPLADRTMADEVDKENLYNLRVQVDGADLTDQDVQGLWDIFNVESAEARVLVHTKVYRGEKRIDAVLVGVKDLDDQHVDRMVLDEGKLPSGSELLTEKVNSLTGVYKGGTGDGLRVIAWDGGERDLTISGVGRSLAHGRTLYDAEGYAVFYGDLDTVRGIGNVTGYNYLSFTLKSMEGSDVDRTTEDIRSYLANRTTIVAFSALPEVREDGTWPGGDFLEMFLTVMYVLTLIAIVSSMFLISNTMNTVVSEQRKEIAMLKAVGATKAMVLYAYLASALLMGAAGSLIGALMGIMLSQGVLMYFGSLMGFSPGFMVHFPTVLLSIAIGLSFVVLASIPALLRSIRVPVREGMDERGISPGNGRGLVNRALMLASFLPKTVDMGIRNAARRKGRSLSAVLQITLAVGMFMGLSAFGSSLVEELSGTIDNVDYDISIIGQQEGARTLTTDLAQELTQVEGVDTVEAYLESQFDLDGQIIYARGYHADTTVKLHQKTMLEGRWFGPAEEGNGSAVAVVGKQLASVKGLEVGSLIEVMTATGASQFEVIGIDGDFYYMGMIVYVPLVTLQKVLRDESAVSGFYLKTRSSDTSDIDRIASRVEDDMTAEGYMVKTDVHYQIKEASINQNKGIINMITLTSGVIVVISMVGLVSNLSLNILDRTKEIGVLRCLGSDAMSIRSIFTSEAVFLSLVGWVLGVPLGYGITTMVSIIVDAMIGWKITVLYPMDQVALSLVLVVIASLLIAQGPIVRAIRMRPGDALRYE